MGTLAMLDSMEVSIGCDESTAAAAAPEVAQPSGTEADEGRVLGREDRGGGGSTRQRRSSRRRAVGGGGRWRRREHMAAVSVAGSPNSPAATSTRATGTARGVTARLNVARGRALAVVGGARRAAGGGREGRRQGGSGGGGGSVLEVVTTWAAPRSSLNPDAAASDPTWRLTCEGRGAGHGEQGEEELHLAERVRMLTQADTGVSGKSGTVGVGQKSGKFWRFFALRRSESFSEFSLIPLHDPSSSDLPRRGT